VLRRRDAEAVRRQSTTFDIIEIDHPSGFDLDVTHRTATDTATAILEHVEAIPSTEKPEPSH